MSPLKIMIILEDSTNVTFGDRRKHPDLKSATFENHRNKPHFISFLREASLFREFHLPFVPYYIRTNVRFFLNVVKFSKFVYCPKRCQFKSEDTPPSLGP